MMKIIFAYLQRIAKTIVFLAICCSCVLELAACSTVTPKTEVEQPQAVDPHAGEPAEIQAFSRVTLKELRDEMPKYPKADFYPKAEEEKEADGGDNIIFVCSMRTEDSPNKAAAYYGKELKNRGWRVFVPRKVNDEKIWLFAKKDYKGILVDIENDKEQQRTAITIIKGWQNSDDTLRIDELDEDYNELK